MFFMCLTSMIGGFFIGFSFGHISGSKYKQNKLNEYKDLNKFKLEDRGGVNTKPMTLKPIIVIPGDKPALSNQSCLSDKSELFSDKEQ